MAQLDSSHPASDLTSDPSICVSPIVHRAKTRRELEAVYRFRYEVYYREFGRLLGRPDHAERQVRDDADELPTTTILYTGTPDRITSTVRLQHWRPGEVPDHDGRELSMDRIPAYRSLACAEIGRLMVRPSRRGQALVTALVKRAYEIFVGEHQSRLVFCYCSPGLTHFYRRIAMRPYGGRLVAAPDGLMIPLVSVTSDREYYEAVGSFLSPMVERYFGPGSSKLEPTDLKPLRSAFESPGLELDRGRVEAALETVPSMGAWLGAPGSAYRRRLLTGALVVDVEVGTLVTRRGFREPELFVVLEGEVSTTGAPARGAGQCFGEAGLLSEDGRRCHTWRCRSAGRLLVLSGRAARSVLRRRDREVA